MRPSPDSILVLHVDDDEATGGLVKSYFEHRSGPISVVSVTSGAEALLRLDDDVDCIVSDYKMPGMDGLELLGRVREMDPNLPFILLTGQGSERVASDAISAGATDYFRKVTTLDGLGRLAQHIENVVARCRAQVSYQQLFENAVEGFSLHDPATGEFVDANESAQAILGYDRAELLELSIDDVGPASAATDPDRSLLTQLRRATTEEPVTCEEFCYRADGTPFWMKVQFKQIEVSGRTLVLCQMRDVTERKRYEQTLSALHTSMADLIAAERASQVGDTVQTAVHDLLDADGVAVFLHDAQANELTLERGATMPATRVDSVPLSSGSPIASAFIDGVAVETDEAAVFDRPDSQRESGSSFLVPLGDHGVLVVDTGDDAVGENTREFVEILAGAATVALDRVQTDREIDSSRAELRSRSDEMERLTQTYGTLHELSSSLLQAETSEDAYDAVCAELSAMEPVSLAWIGGVDGSESFDASVWAGAVPEYLDEVPLDRQSSEPAAIAARTGTTIRVDNTALDIRKEPWRRTALAHGVQSVLAVPIETDGVTYGVLSVLGSEQAAFDDSFHEMVSTIATWLGETVQSLEQQEEALRPSTATVTYELDASDHFLGRLAAEAGGRLDVRGVVTEAADRYRVFLEVTDADPAQVRGLAADLAVVREATVVSDEGDSGTLELELTTPLLGTQLAEHAAAVEELRATEAGVRVTTRVADESDVRAVATAVQERYPGATLLSKRRRPEPLADHNRLLSFRESLTPRQREVVRVAYLNGYFDTPRRCTGEELGEQLDISSQAVYQHLRAAQRKLFDEAFEGSLGALQPDE